ncbi:MAG: T9SS type A sorting domain-containing protein [Sediminibacterium sp.]|nr:T9SS type A sorting domain-containing protein [Sediminibacterium sp.]
MRYYFPVYLSILLLSITQIGLSQDAASIHRKIPIDPKRWYQLTNATSRLDRLFDADLSVEINLGYDKIINYYDAYYPLLDNEMIKIDSVRLYDGNGMGTVPFLLYAIDSNWNRKLIASFTGSEYNKWVGPYPNRINTIQLDTVVEKLRYLMIRSGDIFPTEIECYGYYKAPSTISSIVKKPIHLGAYFGVNGYEWDFENPNINPYIIDEKSFSAVKNFTAVRHYLDWEKLEFTKGSYTYSPTYAGGWNYDTIYQRCKMAGIDVLACIKTIPSWMQLSYPVNLRDNENIPAYFGLDYALPQTYLEQAKLGFQYIARYGANKNVDPTLLRVNQTPRWTGDDINSIKIGLGLIQYIECDNERDKWWKGRQAYQTGREYAANLSAFYDGHKNTMGPGVGVKNADSTVKVVMAGVALATTDYVRGMIDWCKELRGLKADGSVNLCWDIINYHLYTNDATLKRGIAPERYVQGFSADSIAKAFVSDAAIYARNMPVWVTEAGYDINQGSPNKAIAIGNKSALITQADWILRTSLLYARNGVQRLFFYQLHDDTPDFGGLYATSGLINENHTRRPAADFIRQVVQKFAQYSFKQSVSSDPVVDQYVLNDTSLMHVVYVPDEVGRTANCTIDLNNADSAIIYIPTVGSDSMTVMKLKTNQGAITINATETPVFVVGKRVRNAAAVVTDSIKLFPNPANSLLQIIGLTAGKTNEIYLLSAEGKMLKKGISNNAIYAMNIADIAPGVYFIKINNGTNLNGIRFIKTR